jgi:hypothetical protein
MVSTSHVIDLAAMPPSERSMIAIYPDQEIVERRASVSDNLLNSPTARRLGRITRRVILGPVLSIPVERGIDALTNKVAGPGIWYGTQRELDRAKFALPGHLQLRTLYVMHPKDSSRYFPAATFHRMVFEHKFAEAIRLLTALGAAHILVEHEQGWSGDTVGKVHTPVPEIDATVDLAAKKSAAAKSKIMFEAFLDGSDSPTVPNDLVWFPDEPMWQVIADGRMKGAMNKFILELRYSDDFGVNADLIAKVEGTKVGVGGKFTSHVETIWKIHADFDMVGPKEA